jgi:hypothetical protein
MTHGYQQHRVQTALRPPEYVKIRYRRYDGGWQVRDPETGEYEPFADGDADDDDVRQLILKAYDVRY